MAKYLVIGSYTAEGAKGIMREGGSGRIEAARQAVESVGGTLDWLMWAFGNDDYYALVDMPSDAAAAAASLVISGTGTSRSRTIPLMTAADIDAASKMSPTFRPPGA